MEYLLEIRTPMGERYRIREDGAIARRMESGWLTCSGQWTLRGIRHVVRTMEFIPFAQLTPSVLDRLTWTFKNGRPQYTGCDLDHGTRREWGNTQYHGIASIRWIGMTEHEAVRVLLGA